jgi:hypothetical protein
VWGSEITKTAAAIQGDSADFAPRRIYLRRSTSGAAGSGLCTTIKHLRGAAGIDLGNTIKYL